MQNCYTLSTGDEKGGTAPDKKISAVEGLFSEQLHNNSKLHSRWPGEHIHLVYLTVINTIGLLTEKFTLVQLLVRKCLSLTNPERSILWWHTAEAGSYFQSREQNSHCHQVAICVLLSSMPSFPSRPIPSGFLIYTTERISDSPICATYVAHLLLVSWPKIWSRVHMMKLARNCFQTPINASLSDPNILQRILLKHTNTIWKHNPKTIKNASCIYGHIHIHTQIHTYGHTQ